MLYTIVVTIQVSAASEHEAYDYMKRALALDTAWRRWPIRYVDAEVTKTEENPVTTQMIQPS